MVYDTKTFFDEIFPDVELDKELVDKIDDYGLKDLLTELVYDGVVEGIVVFDSYGEVIGYFEEFLKDAYDIPDELLYYFDMERYIEDLHSEGSATLYEIPRGFVLVEGSYSYDERELMEKLEELLEEL